MEGESRDVGAALAAIAVETHDHGRPFSAPCMLLGAGGETTVTLRHEDHLGDGGPNQAAALAAALRVGTGRAIAAAFVDTDGMDGGTGIAGALVDGSTLERAAALDLDLRQALLQHRSSDALCRLGDADRHRAHRQQRQRPVRDRGRPAAERSRSGMSDPGTRGEIVLDGVTKLFGSVVAVHELDLTVPGGEFFSMLGPSGCGKTTTLRMIGGFEEPTSGRILLQGEDVTWVPPAKRNVNMVFQAYGLFPHMTVADNVAFGLKIKRIKRSEIGTRVAEALRMVRLEGLDERRPRQLSGGQQQRVALARALVNRPAALLLDEPLGALDLKLRKEMQLELKAIAADSATTFVYVTHDQEEALTMSDRIAVMNQGVVEQVAQPRELYEHPATPFVAGFIGTSNLLSLKVDERTGGTDRHAAGRRAADAGARPGHDSEPGPDHRAAREGQAGQRRRAGRLLADRGQGRGHRLPGLDDRADRAAGHRRAADRSPAERRGRPGRGPGRRRRDAAVAPRAQLRDRLAAGERRRRLVSSAPSIRVAPPGPRSRELLDRLGAVAYPGLTAELAPFVIARKQGWTVTDVDGNVYLDLISASASVPLGAGREDIIEPAVEMLRRYGNEDSHGLASELMAPLAERLLAAAPSSLTRVDIALNGTEAVEIALKMMRRATGRPLILAFFGSYHGESTTTRHAGRGAPRHLERPAPPQPGVRPRSLPAPLPVAVRRAAAGRNR